MAGGRRPAVWGFSSGLHKWRRRHSHSYCGQRATIPLTAIMAARWDLISFTTLLSWLIPTCRLFVGCQLIGRWVTQDECILWPVGSSPLLRGARARRLAEPERAPRWLPPRSQPGQRPTVTWGLIVQVTCSAPVSRLAHRTASRQSPSGGDAAHLRLVGADVYTDWESVYRDNVEPLYRLMYACGSGTALTPRIRRRRFFRTALGPLRLGSSKGEVRSYLLVTARTVLVYIGGASWAGPSPPLTPRRTSPSWRNLPAPTDQATPRTGRPGIPGRAARTLSARTRNPFPRGVLD